MSRIARQVTFVLLFALSVLRTEPSVFAQSTDKDMAELQHYTLTMPNVTKYWDTIGSLAKIAKDHPDFKDALETDSDKHEDFSAIEKRIASHPVIVSAIKDHGLSVHEFLLVQTALIQSALASAMIPPGADRAQKAAEANVNLANLDFVDKHKAELEALQTKNTPKD